jgi:ankyrin repeat protein
MMKRIAYRAIACGALLAGQIPAIAAEGYIFNPDFVGTIMISAKEEKLPGADLSAKIESARGLLEKEMQQRALCKEGYYIVSAGVMNGITLRARCKDVYTRADEAYWQKLGSPEGPKDRAARIVGAAADGHLKSLRLLLEQDPEGVNVREAQGYTPLAAAVEAVVPWALGNDTVELLLKLRADPNLATKRGMTPLHLLARRLVTIEPPETIRRGELTATLIPEAEAASPEALVTLDLLIRAGADMNSTTAGYAPLHMIAEKGWQTLVSELLRRGADVNTVDHSGRTALWRARAPTFKMLLENKADVNHVDKAGENVLFQLMRDDRPDSVERTQLAIRHGADARRKNLKGQGPLSQTANPLAQIAQEMGMTTPQDSGPVDRSKRKLLIDAGGAR